MIELLSGNGRYFITCNSSRWRKLKKGSENGSGNCTLIIEFLPLISRLRTRTRKKKKQSERGRVEGGGGLQSECPLSHLFTAMYTSGNIIGSIIGRNLRFLSLSFSLSIFHFEGMDPLPGRFSGFINFLTIKRKRKERKRAARKYFSDSRRRDSRKGRKRDDRTREEQMKEGGGVVGRGITIRKETREGVRRLSREKLIQP